MSIASPRPRFSLPPRWRRRLGLAAASLVLAGLVALALHWWRDGRFMVDTDNAYVRADVVAISPQAAGYVVRVEVADNQPVNAGQVLLRIDDRDYQASLRLAQGRLQVAQADLRARQAHLASLQAQLERQRGTIDQAQAQVQAGLAEAERSRLQYRRQSTLSIQQATSTELLETADADARKALAGLAQARAGLRQARQQLPVLQADRDQAAAELQRAHGTQEQAHAELEHARLALEHTVVRAPAAGTIGQRVARPGQYVDVGTPLMALVPTEAYVMANYKETQSAAIRPGQPVTISVDAFDGAELRGHVDSFAPASGAQFALLPPDNATGNFTKIVQRLPLRIRIDPGQPGSAGLRPGMSVETRVDTRQARP